jgi:Zn-dependent alcohol dehydrogenases, class III
VQSPDGPINVGPITALSEYTVVSENRATLLPEGVPLKVAPLLGCALTTGFGAVTREARVVPGESAVIIGFGGVGISLLKSLQLVSSTPICVVDKDPAKVELALKLGAQTVILSSEETASLPELVEQKIGRKPDVVFEATGVKELIEASISMAHQNGRAVLIGVPDASRPAEIATLPLHLGKSLIGSHGGALGSRSRHSRPWRPH